MYHSACLRIRTITALAVTVVIACPQLRVAGQAGIPTDKEDSVFYADMDISAPTIVLLRDARVLPKTTPSDTRHSSIVLSAVVLLGWADSRTSVHRMAMASWNSNQQTGTKDTSLLDLGCLLTI